METAVYLKDLLYLDLLYFLNFRSFLSFFFSFRDARRVGYFPVRAIPFGLGIHVSFLIVLLHNL